MVPGGRIELPTPAFSGPRSTGELPRHRSEHRILRARTGEVKDVNEAAAPDSRWRRNRRADYSRLLLGRSNVSSGGSRTLLDIARVGCSCARSAVLPVPEETEREQAETNAGKCDPLERLGHLSYLSGCLVRSRII